MIRTLARQLSITLLVASLTACGSGGVDFGDTIADLEDLPLPETDKHEPEVSFEIDQQQVIESYRALV